MSQIDNLKEQLKSAGTSISQRIEESPTYAQLKDRYENLSPTGQKGAQALAALLVLFFLFFIPLNNLSESQTSLSLFEEKRDLIRDLFKTYRETSATPDISIPPTQDMLRSNIESIITRADLLPEQKLGISEIAPEGRLIPSGLINNVLQVQLAKLNLKQIVDIGSSIVAISNSVKMKDLFITANRQDTRYYDVTYKLYSLKVPQPNIEPPPEPETKRGKARGNN